MEVLSPYPLLSGDVCFSDKYFNRKELLLVVLCGLLSMSQLEYKILEEQGALQSCSLELLAHDRIQTLVQQRQSLINQCMLCKHRKNLLLCVENLLKGM